MARGFNYAHGADSEVTEAETPDLTRDRLLALGASSNKYVREVIAARSDCPLGLLVTLAHDNIVPVRVAVASNPVALRSVMAYLCGDRHVEVVGALIRNPALPTDLVDELSFHRKAVIRDAAVARLNATGGASAAMEDAHTPELRDRAFESQEDGQGSGAAVASNVTAEVPFGTDAVSHQMPQTTPGLPPAAAAPPTPPLPVPMPMPVTQTPVPVPATSWTATGAAAPPASGTQAPVQAQEPPAQPAARVAPTRTAPVRGFRPPAN